MEGRSADKEEIYNPGHGSEISPLLTSVSPHSFVGLPSAFRRGFGGFIARREGRRRKDGEDGNKSCSGRRKEARRRRRRKRRDGEPRHRSARLMNVWRRVAAPPQGAALVTEGAWLGVVIESNDN